MRRILRDPLIHFLLFGGAIFLVYYFLNPPGESVNGNTIHITQSDIHRFKQIFQKQWQRSPTVEELQGLIKAQLNEEVLYREALAMGLEKDDTIVRRRLAQKVEFLLNDMIVPTQVSDKDLIAFYKNNADRYTQAAKLSFRQIYFNPGLRKEGTQDQANATLHTLQATKVGFNAANNLGDQIMLQNSYRQIPVDDVAREFGADFANNLVALPTGVWQGPIKSVYGLHLIFISEREAASVYPFEQIRDRVKNDYLYQLQQTSNDAVLAKLKSRYKIIIDDEQVPPQ